MNDYHEYVHAEGQSHSEWCAVCDLPWSAFVHRVVRRVQ